MSKVNNEYIIGIDDGSKNYETVLMVIKKNKEKYTVVHSRIIPRCSSMLEMEKMVSEAIEEVNRIYKFEKVIMARG